MTPFSVSITSNVDLQDLTYIGFFINTPPSVPLWTLSLNFKHISIITGFSSGCFALSQVSLDIPQDSQSLSFSG
ncbi:hypothetical protein ES703_31088 [subsurface metagenome]